MKHKDKVCQYSSYLVDAYSRDNTDGFIELAYAENRLLFDLSLLEKIKLCRKDISLRSTRYEFPYGSPELRKSFAVFWGRLADVKSCRTPLSFGVDESTTIHPENLVMVSGCLSAIEIALAAILTPGDAVLIPSPYYGRYSHSVAFVNRGIIIPVDCSGSAKDHNIEAFNLSYEDAYVQELLPSLRATLKSARMRGVSVKALIVTNPHSPLNIILSSSTMLALVEFAEENGIHLISDEIFAPNVLPVSSSESFGSDHFISMIKLSQSNALAHVKNIKDFVHTVTGLGKLGFAGWKVGALYSENQDLIQKCKELSFSRQISTDTQFMVHHMLSDQKFSSELLRKNSERLGSAYHKAKVLLEKAKIPYRPCVSGLAVLLDFRNFVTNFDEEAALQEEIFGKAKVLLDRGEHYSMPEPGWFRIVFACEFSLFSRAVMRVEAFLTKRNDDFFKVVEMSYRQKFEACWKRTDFLFSLLTEEGFLERPIGLRFPFLFYMGHFQAFNWKQFIHYLGLQTSTAEFDALFERGIDPDVETGECHPHSGDIHADKEYWPSISQVKSYQEEIRSRTISSLGALCSYGKSDFGGTKVLDLCLEHELMHQETLLYMFVQLDKSFIREDMKDRPPFKEEEVETGRIPASATKFLVVPEGEAKLGGNPVKNEFKWDIEMPEHKVSVSSFSIRQTPITVEEFYTFVKDDGYSEPKFWTKEDYEWKLSSGLEYPASWLFDEANSQWFVRTVASNIPLEKVYSWPVFVSLAEARAYCCWKGNLRLPTEEEYHRAAFCSNSSEQRVYPWGNDAPSPSKGNFGFCNFFPTPVDKFTEGKSFWGLLDTIGNGWELTESVFRGLPGYSPNIPSYPGYSSDFFDGKHYVVCGSSWCTDLSLIRSSFRNWYQSHYPYVFSKFRPCLNSKESNKGDRPSSSPESQKSHIRYHFLNSNIDSTCNEKQFCNDVVNGLSKHQKTLPSVYFYDDVGSDIFSAITNLDEYYLTRTELGILKQNLPDVGAVISQGSRKFNLIELGAGDGTKTEVVISELLKAKHSFNFIPIDISVGALETMATRLYENVEYTKPWQTTLLVGDNMDGLQWITNNSNQTNVVMFLGSSIGNFDPESIVAFISKVRSFLRPDDYLLIGFDLKKSGRVISNAYDDSKRVTEAFNLNLLERINRELEGNFVKENFEFYSSYEAHSGDVNSYLISKCDQTVNIGICDATFSLKNGEAIHTERSRKFFMSDVHKFAEESGFEVVRDYTDPDKKFVDSLWKVKKELKPVLSKESFERYLA